MDIYYGIIMQRKVIKFSIHDIQIVYKPLGYGLCTISNDFVNVLSGEYYNKSFPIIHKCSNDTGAVIFDIKDFFTIDGIDENIKKHYEYIWHQTYNLYYPNERKFEEITDKTKINKCMKAFENEKNKCKILLQNN